MDAFFGAAGRRDARARARAAAPAQTRWSASTSTSPDAAFGTTRDITLDTAIVCSTCSGAGTAAGTHPETCQTCGGRGEMQSVQRSFLGQIVTSRTCPDCGGVGSKIRNPCHDCGGAGRVRARRTVTVKVPAGVDDGMRLRLSGEGEVGPGGGPAGDLYVEIHQREHPLFTRDGDDLHCRVDAADDGSGARHRGEAGDPRRRGDVDRQAGYPVGSRADACGLAASRTSTAGSAAATCTSTTRSSHAVEARRRAGAVAARAGPAARRGDPRGHDLQPRDPRRRRTWPVLAAPRRLQVGRPGRPYGDDHHRPLRAPGSRRRERR